MDAEGTNIGTSFARHPENTKVALVVELKESRLVDGTDTQLTLDGRDQRRALEQCTTEMLKSRRKSLLASLDSSVEADDAKVLLSSSLLRLDKARRTVNAGKCNVSNRGPPTKQTVDSYQTIKQPVTLGSRVPLWPVFSH